MRHRIDSNELLNTVKHLKKLAETCRRILIFFNETIGHSTRAGLPVIKKGISLFAEHANSSILGNLLEIQLIGQEYEQEERHFIQVLESLYTNAATHLAWFNQSLDMQNATLDTEVITNVAFDLQLLRTSLKMLEKKQNSQQNVSHLPGRLAFPHKLTYDDCNEPISYLIKHVDTLYDKLQEKLDFDSQNTSVWETDIKTEIKDIFLKDELFRKCLGSFPSSLDKVLSYREKAESIIEDILQKLSSDTTLLMNDGLYETAEEIYQRFEHLLYNYSNGVILKESLADTFHQNQIRKTLSELNAAVKNPIKKAVDYLRLQVKENQDVCTKLYSNVLEKVAEFDKLHPKSVFKSIARSMDIFRAPIPDLELPELYRFTLNEEELWKNWPGYLTLTEYCEMMASQIITKLCKGYFEVLNRKLDDISTKSEMLSCEVEAALENMSKHMKLYSDAILMKDKFIK